MKKAFLEHSCLLNSLYCEQRKNKIKYLNFDTYFFKKIGILLSPSYETNNWKFEFFCDPDHVKFCCMLGWHLLAVLLSF